MITAVREINFDTVDETLLEVIKSLRRDLISSLLYNRIYSEKRRADQNLGSRKLISCTGEQKFQPCTRELNRTVKTYERDFFLVLGINKQLINFFFLLTSLQRGESN